MLFVRSGQVSTVDCIKGVRIKKPPGKGRGFQITENPNRLLYFGTQGLQVSSFDAIHFRTASSTVIFSTSTSKIIGAC